MSKQLKKAEKKNKPAKKVSTAQPKTIRFFLPEILIFLTAFLIYSNTLNHEYAFDDDVITKKNFLVQKGVNGISEIFKHSYTYGFDRDNSSVYRPLVIAFMALEIGMFGNSPVVHHLFNVILFGICCVLFYRLLVNLFSTSHGSISAREIPLLANKPATPHFAKGNSFSTSVLANHSGILLSLSMVFLFVTHPIHTEVVANIKSRDEILCFIFVMLSLSAALRYYDTGKIIFFGGMLLFFFGSLITKETGVTFLLLTPVTLFFFRDTKAVPLIKIIAGLGVIFLIYMLIRSEVLDKTRGNEMKLINNSLAGIKELSELIPTKICLLGKYLGMLFYPHPLSHDYSFNQIPVKNWSNSVTVVTVLIFVVMVIFSIMYFFKKNKLAYCLIFFFVTLSPVSNMFFLISATFAERFLFLPSLGFCVGVPLLMERILLFSRIKNKWFEPLLFILILSVIIVLFSVKTINRNPDWKNNFTLFASGVKNAPNSFRVHAGNADQFRVKGEEERNPALKKKYLQHAISEYKKSISILEDTPPNWYNLGVCYYTLEDKENARNAYIKAVALDTNHKDALNNLGVIYFEKREFAEAQRCFERVVTLDPRHGAAYGNLGAVYHNLGKYEQALENYRKSLELLPDNRNVRENLGKLEVVTGRVGAGK